MPDESFPEPSLKPSGEPIAVLVCHGMGQQAPFETLNDVAEALLAAHMREGWTAALASTPCCTMPARPLEARPRYGERELGRVDFQYVSGRESDSPTKRLEPIAKLAMKAPAGFDGGGVQEFHFYEAYWAPLTEGVIGIVDVLYFLLRAAWDGVKERGEFERYVFGEKSCYTMSSWVVKINLAAAFLTVFSVCLLAVSFLGVLIADATRHIGITAAAQRVETLRNQLGYFFPWMVTGALFPIVNAWFQKVRRDPSSIYAVGADVISALLALAPIVLFGLRTFWAWMFERDICWLTAWDDLFLKIFYSLVLLFGFVYLRRRGPGGRKIIAFALLLIVAVLLIHTLGETGFKVPYIYRATTGFKVPYIYRATRGYWDWRYAWLPTYLFFAASGTVLVYTTWYFLTKFAGDATAYISAHAVNRFWSTREAIQKKTLDTALAVYGRKEQGSEGHYYGNVVVVAHSLGSVIAYDTLNALINLQECEAQSGLTQVAERTRLFLTCGCPLNKVAFLFRFQTLGNLLPKWRDLLNNYRQPLILNLKYRPQRWINIWSHADWIGGPLTYYEPRGKRTTAPKDEPVRTDQMIDDRLDPEAFFPLYEHTTYFKHHFFQKMLYQGIWGPIATVASEPQRRRVVERRARRAPPDTHPKK